VYFLLQNTPKKVKHDNPITALLETLMEAVASKHAVFYFEKPVRQTSWPTSASLIEVWPCPSRGMPDLRVGAAVYRPGRCTLFSSLFAARASPQAARLSPLAPLICCSAVANALTSRPAATVVDANWRRAT